MDMMAAALCMETPASPAAQMEFVPSSVTPASPDPEQSSALAEAPAVPPKKVAVMPTAQKKRCLLTALGDKAWERESSPDDESVAAVVMPGMCLTAGADEMQSDAGGKSAGQDQGKPPGVERPRLWTRPKKKACVVPGMLERSASFAEAPELKPDEQSKLDLDMQFELIPLSSCVEAAETVETVLERFHAADVERLSSPVRMPAEASLLRTPPRTTVVLQDIEYNLSPLKQLRLFDRFELLTDADEL